MKKFFIFTPVLATVLGVAFLNLFNSIEKSLIFYPEKLPSNFVYSFPYPFEEINLTMKDKTLINSLYFPSKQGRGIILYFHGNAESLRNWGYVAGDFLPLNWDLFIIDYRGFGKSAGEPYEDKLYSDAFEIYEYLKKRFPSKEILPYGRSIGTAIAAKLALEKNTQRLILETPYTSLPELAKIYFPFIPSFLISYRLNTFDYTRNYMGKVLVLHGTHDEIIPVEMGREFQNLGDKLTYIEIPYGNHNNLSQFEKFRKAISSFILD